MANLTGKTVVFLGYNSPAKQKHFKTRNKTFYAIENYSKLTVGDTYKVTEHYTYYRFSAGDIKLEGFLGYSFEDCWFKEVEKETDWGAFEYYCRYGKFPI